MASFPRLPDPLYRATATVIVPAHPSAAHRADRPESHDTGTKVNDAAKTAADRRRFAIDGSA